MPFQPLDTADATAERVAELSALYEVARALVGARDPAQAAARLVLTGLGTLGARSGAILVATERGRYRVLHGAGLDAPATGETVAIPEPAREWMLRESVFEIGGTAAARGLGSLRDRLAGDFDAAWGAAIADAHGLAGVLLFGPRLLPGSFGTLEQAVLEAMAALAARALESRPATAHATPAPERRRSRNARSLQALREAYPPLAAMVGESGALLEACQDLLAIAPTRFPALISGESGVGKELAARAIHELSDRAHAPFETLDCGSIPRELIESELFGHVRGAFTGAHRDRRGLFEIAHRGTLFLDEIGEMPLQLQTRLLRVIQEGRLRRVGDESPIEVDVRVVAATHRDLKREVAEGRFREDLFYRLNVFTVQLPALRDRIGDLEPLVQHFLRRQGRELGVAEWEVAPEVLAALAAHPWPGNVRELANLCAALAVRGRQDGAIGLDELAAVWRRQHPGETPPWTGAPAVARDHLGGWVLEQARAARFNLVEAARQLARRKQRGQAVPLTERSALTYYLTGEILRALAECEGDEAGAARQLAGDDDLAARIAARVRKVADVVREARGDARGLKRTFAKLPAGYEAALEDASSALRER